MKLFKFFALINFCLGSDPLLKHMVSPFSDRNILLIKYDLIQTFGLSKVTKEVKVETLKKYQNQVCQFGKLKEIQI